MKWISVFTVFFVLLFVGCGEKEPLSFKYNEGDIVYHKASGNRAVVVEQLGWPHRKPTYSISYSDAEGEIHRFNALEFELEDRADE